MLARHYVHDRAHLGAGLRQRDVRLETGNRLEVLATAAGERLRDVIADRRPDIGGIVEIRGQYVRKARRHDADDGERLIAQDELFARNLRIGVEAPLPKPVADDDDKARVGTVFLDAEIAPERWGDAKQFEVARRNAQPSNHLRLALPGQHAAPR